ncbi:MAG: serine/threonine protein kinase [Planctomycetes bacterium]|nr:serine/threonine protein kinase [Planctomycetota bacterium]
MNELLLELVAVDMEHRWRIGNEVTGSDDEDAVGPKPTLADYLASLDRLGPIAELPGWIVAEEYRVRQLWGDQPNLDQFIAQYPSHLGELVRLLPKIDPELTADSAIVRPQQRLFSPTEPDPRAPLPFTDYVLEQHLGSGGMGKVYRATQRSLRRHVAVKALLKSRQNDPVAVEQFVREARLVGQLKHPNIVSVHGLGRFPGGGYFLVMELVEGHDLALRLRSEILPIAEAVRITVDVASAIQHAHQQGIVHCDLKPANVLLDAAQHVFVTDFGFAQLIAKTPGQAAGVGGTAGYMAPEQLNSEVGEIGPATDIYGLGALFYSLLTRQPPGGLPIALASREIVPTIVRPRDLREDVPAEVEDICLRCLQWRPTDRYQRAADIIAALQPWVARPRA